MSIASAGLASGWWTDTRIHRLEGIVVSFAGLALLDATMRARRAAPAPEAP
jgi:hypothetical protein